MMKRFGVLFGVAVALGVASSEVLRLPSGGYLLLAGAAALLVARNARVWFLVPFAWGLLAAEHATQMALAHRVTTPLRASGWIEVIAVEGRGAVVRVEGRRILVARADSLGLVPGFEARGFLRIDPIVGLEEPAAFRVERWARTRHLDGRGHFLGKIENRRAAPGVRAALRRTSEAAREGVRRRLVGPGGPSGELLVALLLGDRTGLDPADREAFRRAGLSHVLALSGMHVSLLALGLASVFGALRLGPVPTFVAQSGALVAFTILTGCLAPVVRSCGTALLARAGALIGRRGDPLHALGLVGGCMLLADPALLGDLGFRLSFSATAFLLIAATGTRERSRGRSRIDAARGSLLESLRVSCAIVLGTGADLAETMGRLSLLAPVTNLLSAIPSFAALGWGAFAGFAPLPNEAIERLARSARFANVAVLELCRAASRVPGSDLPIPAPGLAASALAIGIGLSVARGRWPNLRARRAILLLALFASFDRFPKDRITFFDIGQGDSVLIERGKSRVLVDAGPPDERPSLDGSQLAERAVRRRGSRSLDAVVLSHGHLDHGGGLPPILFKRLARRFVVPRRAPGDDVPSLLRDWEAKASASRVPPLAGGTVDEPIRLAGGSIEVFSPWPQPHPPLGTDENDLSLVTRWNAHPLSALLTGDLEQEGEAALLSTSAPGTLGAWILKAGHHGGRTSTSDELLTAVSPRLLVVSCGTGNPHGHPHSETLGRASRRRLVVLRTDLEGTISLVRTSSGVRIRWERGYPLALEVRRVSPRLSRR